MEKSPAIAKPIISEKGFGKALAATLITPSQPQAICAITISSSPLTTKKLEGRSFNIAIICAISGPASLIPAILGCDAKRSVVDAVIFLPVRPGTLYNKIGLGAASANAT